MSGSKSRNKGRRLEQEAVNAFKSHDVPAKRISMMETAGEDKGDLEVGGCWTIEVKGGDQVPKFIYDAIKNPGHLLVCKRDRKQWKIVMDLEWFLDTFL
jgi:hypothetical protein